MTIDISNNDPRISYSVASGVTQTSFVVPFEFFDDSDVNVYVNNVLKTITTDYTVSGGDGSTGTITISVTGPAVVTLTREITIERITDFPTGIDINRAALNTQLDTLTAIAADIKDGIGLALTYNDSTVGVPTEMPPVDDMKGNVLAFNASTGAPEAGPSISEISSAQTYATNASASATAAASSASSASTSATASASSASASATSASAASASETASAASEAASAASAVAAAASETAAAASESAASTSAATATTQASSSAASAAAAAASESAAATSETNAANSATAAAASQVSAAASAAAAASAYDTFDDRYLGSKTSDPTLDNDGNALVAGALYFNSVENEMRVYDGATWIAASSAGGASLLNFNYTATSGQTTFSGADDNTATLSYTQSNLIVTLNGIVLEDGTDYTATDGTSIVLATGAATGDELNIVAFKSFTVADTVSASSGGTFSGPVTFAGGTVGAGGGLFKGENGEVGSSAGDIFRINEQTLNTNVTIDADENASATGPLAIASGVTLTVTSGGNLSIV